MGNYLMSTTTAEKHANAKPTTRSTNDRGRPNVQLKDLPEDLLCTILSNLPAKEAVRSSVLSSEWRSIWTTCPKLSFNGKDHAPRHGRRKHAQMFIDYVNAVLKKHHGKAVDNLEIKFIVDSKLVYHLNNWLRFAMSSRTKILAFDLAPSRFLKHGDHYRFPFELLDKESVSCLRCLQLSFVCFKPPPSQFTGFPNLRKFDLHLLNTTRHDLENILCNCCNLEWLSIVRCHLDDELTVVRRPLSHLQYLRVKYCRITKIEFHAAKLSTFVFDGDCIPIALHHASELENAEICFSGSTFQHGAAVVLNGLPHVQNLTLQFSIQAVGTTWTLDSHHTFSRLRHVQIILVLSHVDDDKIIIYLVSLLRVAPFIEHLEVHLDCTYTMWFASSDPSILGIPPSEQKYHHLKNIHVTGFKATEGQLQLLLHVVENGPAIKTVTVDTIQRLSDLLDPEEIAPALPSSVLDFVRDPLSERLPPDAKLYLL